MVQDTESSAKAKLIRITPTGRIQYGNRPGRPAGPGGPVFLKLHRTAKLTKQKLFGMAPSGRIQYGNRPAGPQGRLGRFFFNFIVQQNFKSKSCSLWPLLEGSIQYGNINSCVACTKSDSVSIRRSLACISFNHGRLCTRVLRCVHGCRRAKRAQVHRGEAEMHLFIKKI